MIRWQHTRHFQIVKNLKIGWGPGPVGPGRVRQGQLGETEHMCRKTSTHRSEEGAKTLIANATYMISYFFV